MLTKRGALAAGLTLTAAIATAAATRGPSETASCALVLGSEVCTWVVSDGGRVTELGATIPLKLVESVSSDAEMVWPPQELAAIELPAIAREVLGLHHLGINWEAHGHPPATFLTEHFDFHFYNVPAERQGAIDCSDESKSAHLPGGYALPDVEVPGMGTFIGLCVPGMGMHAMQADEVDATAPFAADMIIGYYGSKPIFFEPMISRALLRGRQDFSLEMPSVHGLAEGVRYPTAFRAEYDESADAYHLIFTGFAAD
jgi:hypothetical protein